MKLENMVKYISTNLNDYCLSEKGVEIFFRNKLFEKFDKDHKGVTKEKTIEFPAHFLHHNENYIQVSSTVVCISKSQ